MVVVCHWPPLEQNYSPSDITATLLTDFGKGAKLHVYSAVVVDIAQSKTHHAHTPCTVLTKCKSKGRIDAGLWWTSDY